MRCMRCPEIINMGRYCQPCSAKHVKGYVPPAPRYVAPEPTQYPDGESRSTNNVFCWRGQDSIFYSSAQAERQAKLRAYVERNQKR